MVRALLIVFFTALVVAAPPAGGAELLSLKDGTLYLGEVTEMTDSTVTIRVLYPAEETRTIQRDALSDSTLWRLLSRRIPAADGKARMKLGRWAEEHGLLIPALSEYLKAARVQEHSAQAMERIAVIETTLALELLDRGEEYLLAKRPGSALQYFEMVMTRYPDSPAALLARKRAERVKKEIAAAKAAEEAAANQGPKGPPSAWEKRADAIAGHLRRAARYEQKPVHGNRPVRQTRTLERAIRHLESAWELGERLGPPPEGVPVSKTAELKATVKRRLVRAYLDIGLAYLLRNSLNQAEEYCANACDLDPENAASHSLHERIIDARVTTQWGGWYDGGIARHRR